MRALTGTAVWLELRSPRFALLLVTLGFCLVRARDQPSLDVSFSGTTASIVPGDLLLLALACVAVWTVVRGGLPNGTRPALVVGGAFCLLLVGTALANGAGAFVSGGKLTELAALGLAAAVLVRSRSRLEAVVDVLLLFTIAADTLGAVRFITNGGRQASFLGEHDFAALATLPLLYGVIRLFTGEGRARTAVAIAAGSIGCLLGAALASLAGLYLGVAVVFAVMRLRRWWTWRAAGITTAVVVAITAGTLVIRAGDLGFLQSWFGKPETRPGQYAASWSQRLIYAYIGGRVFLAHPFLGTGWYGELPPKEFVAYLPAARRRFADQPPAYFPPATKPFIPQQGWDQVLYELGVAGGALMLGLLVALGRSAVRAADSSAALVASLPAAWLAASIGAVAGEGLFGGTPLAATFWLVTGVIVAVASRTFAA